MNIITVVTLPDRTPIELNELEIELDIDSFSWNLTGQLWGASSLALIEPDQSGPKQVEININGWVWVFIIERYSTDRRFGNTRELRLAELTVLLWKGALHCYRISSVVRIRK